MNTTETMSSKEILAFLSGCENHLFTTDFLIRYGTFFDRLCLAEFPANAEHRDLFESFLESAGKKIRAAQSPDPLYGDQKSVV